MQKLDPKKRHFYLCPPTFYEIKYSINQWMDIDSKVDKELASKQWQSLCKAYEKLGVEVTIIPPTAGIPELVFPGDSIFLFGDHAISSNFRFQERQPEVEPQSRWFASQGFTVHTLPPDVHFEGNAEAILWNNRFLCGYGIRSDREAFDLIHEVTGMEVVPLKLVEPFFHLDVAVCPLDSQTLAYVPEAFDAASRAVVESLPAKLIRVNSEEANVLGCNSMAVDGTAILSTPAAPRFAAQLKEHGFNVITLDMSEFRKSGGGVKCLTLEAYKPVMEKAAS